MGNAYLMYKDTTDAVISYENSLKYYGKNYYVYGFLGKYFFDHHNMEKARFYRQKYDSVMALQNNQRRPQ